MSMTFLEIQDEVIDAQFSERKRDNVKRWINLRYAQAWSAHDWSFTYATATVSPTAATRTLTKGVTVQRVIELNDENGEKIDYVTPYDYRPYRDTLAGSGRPEVFTVVGGSVLLGPVPDATYSDWTLWYRVGLTELSANGDVPALPAEFHYLLVHGALATGLVLENDPTWQQHQSLWLDLLNSMAGQYANDWAGTAQLSADRL